MPALRYPLSLNFSSELILSAWDEIFLNLTEDRWTGNRHFERNRAFLGLRQNYNGFTFEYGYLNQYVPRSSGRVMEHILSLSVFI